MRRTNKNLLSQLEEKNGEIDAHLLKISTLEATGIAEFQDRLIHASDDIEEVYLFRSFLTP
jgi:hypothetical protein